MSLPKIPRVTYSCNHPAIGGKIDYIQYTVAHEKALLLAQESNDSTTMLNTLKAVINDCTMGKVDVSTIPMFELEYLFLQIHARSSGEESEIIVSCKTEGCTGSSKRKLNLLEIPIKVSPNHTKTITFDDTDIGVMMKYPTPDINTDDEEFIVDCIDYVFQGEQVFPASKSTKEELKDFVMSLTNENFKKMMEFFKTIPKVQLEFSATCPVCKTKHDYTLTGLSDFFQ